MMKIITQVSEAVVSRMHHLISLPDAAECDEIAEYMYAERGMYGCVGALDGKHFAIECVLNDGLSYKNYKGFYSVTLLGVADHLYRFRWISDVWPGNLHSKVPGSEYTTTFHLVSTAIRSAGV